MRLPFANMLYGDIHIRNPFYIGVIKKDKAQLVEPDNDV